MLRRICYFHLSFLLNRVRRRGVLARRSHRVRGHKLSNEVYYFAVKLDPFPD